MPFSRNSGLVRRVYSSMVELFFLIVVAAWIAVDTVRDWLQFRREAQRLREKAELRRRMLARDPDSPMAYERLGDALREAGETAEAIQCYEEAIRRRDVLRNDTKSSGWSNDSGALDNKLRLARFACEAEREPSKYGQSLQTRQQVCRTCGSLSGAHDIACATCGTLLPTDGFWDTLRQRGLRTEILREVTSMFVKFALVCAVVLAATSIPWEFRGVLLISAVIVLPIHFLKKIGSEG